MEDSSGNGIVRREFLGRCSSALQAMLFAGVAAPLIQACETSQVLRATSRTIDVDVRALDADGEFLITTERGSNGDPILIVRTTAASFLAISMECTHNQCTVNTPANGVIHCDCHGSEFDMSGTVIGGPAPSPLQRYSAVYDASRSILTVSI